MNINLPTPVMPNHALNIIKANKISVQLLCSVGPSKSGGASNFLPRLFLVSVLSNERAMIVYNYVYVKVSFNVQVLLI